MRRLILAAGLAALPFTSMAEETPVTEVYACAELMDDAARLTCYDEAVGRLKTAEEAGEIMAVTREEITEVQRDTFGFSFPSLPKLALPKIGGGNEAGAVDENGQLLEIAVAVTDIRRNPYGKIIVTLENGQVWQQTDAISVPYSRRRGVEDALIKRAAFGSYRIKLDGGRAFRAKRIE